MVGTAATEELRTSSGECPLDYPSRISFFKIYIGKCGDTYYKRLLFVQFLGDLLAGKLNCAVPE